MHTHISINGRAVTNPIIKAGVTLVAGVGGLIVAATAVGIGALLVPLGVAAAVLLMTLPFLGLAFSIFAAAFLFVVAMTAVVARTPIDWAVKRWRQRDGAK